MESSKKDIRSVLIDNEQLVKAASVKSICEVILILLRRITVTGKNDNAVQLETILMKTSLKTSPINCYQNKIKSKNLNLW